MTYLLSSERTLRRDSFLPRNPAVESAPGRILFSRASIDWPLMDLSLRMAAVVFFPPTRKLLVSSFLGVMKASSGPNLGKSFEGGSSPIFFSMEISVADSLVSALRGSPKMAKIREVRMDVLMIIFKSFIVFLS